MEIENEQLRLRIIDLEEKLKQTEMQAAMERKNHAREIESLIQQRAFVSNIHFIPVISNLTHSIHDKDSIQLLFPVAGPRCKRASCSNSS